MKKKLLLLLSMGVIALSSVACSDNDNKDAIISKEKYPLMAFAVKVDKSYYHAKIDQTTRKIVIGAIENANTIGDVDYTLMDENTTISPDPHTFLNKWKKEQTVTVTTADQKSTTYTIELTKFNNKYDNLLFIDEFDLDGTPDSEKSGFVGSNGGFGGIYLLHPQHDSRRESGYWDEYPGLSVRNAYR